MSQGFFVDTTLCTGCRGCQVACKQWHGLPAEHTKNTGSFQNPADLSFDTYKLVRMTEEIIDKKLRWLFFPDQCRHCNDAPCLQTANDPGSIFQDSATGAVLYTSGTKDLSADDIIGSCPYNIPRKAASGMLAKCDMCNDRVTNGLLPACVQTCPTGTMNFGKLGDMKAMAEKRLGEIKAKYPGAKVLNPDTVRVIYLTAFDPLKYHPNAVASRTAPVMNRKMALRKMLSPLGAFARV